VLQLPVAVMAEPMKVAEEEVPPEKL